MEKAQDSTKTRQSAPAQERTSQKANQGATAPCLLSCLGNLAIQGILQPKLAVGHPNDPYEREADRMADYVLGAAHTRPPAISALAAAHVQRPCATCMDSGPKSCCEDDAQGVVQTKRDSSADGGGHDGGAHKADLSFLNGGGFSLPASTRQQFEARFGRSLSHVRLHTGSAAAAANVALQARAFTISNHIAFAAGSYAPETPTGRWLLAHELTHVLQQQAGAHPLIQRWTDEDLYFRHEWNERREAERLEARRRHDTWVRGHTEDHAAALNAQNRTLDEDVTSSRASVTRLRMSMLEQVFEDQAAPADPMWEPFRSSGLAPPLPDDLLPSWRAAELSRQTLETMLRGEEVNDEVAESVRASFSFFFQSLSQASEAQERHERQLQERLTTRRATRAMLGGGTPCPSCHSTPTVPDFGDFPNFDSSFGGNVVTAGEFVSSGAVFDANPTGWIGAHLESDLMVVRQALYLVERARDMEQWRQMLREYAAAVAVMDRLLLQRLPRSSEIAQAFVEARDLLQRQEQLRERYPNAIKIPAVFYPEDKFIEVDDPAGGGRREVAQGIPWMFYLTHTENPSHDRWAEGFEWVLHDVTSANRPSARYRPSDVLMAVSTPSIFIDPPRELFTQLNHRLRFPRGHLYWTAPSGRGDSIATTEPWTLSDWLKTIGLTLSVLALVLGTAGYGTPAAVALIAASGVNIAGTLTDLSEKQEFGVLTQRDLNEATLSITLDVISGLTAGLGQVYGLSMRAAARATATGVSASRALTVASGARRLWFVSQTAGAAGDAAKIYITGADFVQNYRLIQSQTNLTEAQRTEALRNLVFMSLLNGTLSLMSLRGGIQDLRRGTPVHIEIDPESGSATVRPATAAEAADPSGVRTDVEGAPGGTRARTSSAAGEAEGPNSRVHSDPDVQAHTTMRNATGETHEFSIRRNGWITRCSENCTNITDSIIDRLNDVRGRLPPNSAHIERMRQLANQVHELDEAARAAARSGSLDEQAERLLARARALEMQTSMIERDVGRELAAFRSAAPRDWPVRQVSYDTLPRDLAGNIDTLPHGIVYEFPGGHRVWRLENGGIAHDSYIGPSHGRQRFEQEFYRPGEANRRGYERAHTLGQGTGFESPFAIPYAPSAVNQRLQNDGIEEFLRGLRDQAPPGGHFHVITETHMRPGSLDLQSIIYRVEFSQDGARTRLFEFNIDVGGTPTNPHLTYNISSVTSNPDLMDMMLSVDVPQRVRTRVLRGAAAHRAATGTSDTP